MAPLNKLYIEPSLKDIPLPTDIEFKVGWTNKLASYIKRFLWDAFFKFCEDAEEEEEKETFGLKSGRAPPPITRNNYGEHYLTIKDYVADLYKMVPQLKMGTYNGNAHQEKLRGIINNIKTRPEVVVHADKTRNVYLTEKEDYQKMKLEDVTKEYKKVHASHIDKINLEAKSIAEELELDDRLEQYKEKECFITIKDHKEPFVPDTSKAKRRLINPAVSHVGVVSKILLEKIIEETLAKTGLNLWKSTQEALKWFNGTEKGNKTHFLSYDIKDFYPNIKEPLLDKAIEFARKYTHIDEQTIRIIKHCRKNILIDEKRQVWIKKSTNGEFDVTQGSLDSCQICELVGIYLLSEIAKFVDPKGNGLYRDDGLLMLRMGKRQMEILRQKLVKLFGENGFTIEVKHSVKSIEFLDVQMDITTNTHRPYKKPIDKIKYVHKDSNHPPAVIKQIPRTVEDRLSMLSSTKEIFEEIKGPYQQALKDSGHDHQLKFNENVGKKKKKSRHRKVIWFNPPWSKSLKTPVGKIFLSLLEKHFPKGSPLYRFYNKQTIKISYSTVRNLKAHITSHNRKILSPPKLQDESCNCQDKSLCVMPGKCRARDLVYGVKATTQDNDVKRYQGQAVNFKNRHYKHKHALKYEDSPEATALSRFVWSQRKAGKEDPKLEWSDDGRAPHYRSGSRVCGLCNLETYKIAICPESMRLNQHSELLKKCIHKHYVELRNVGKPGLIDDRRPP